MIGVRHEQLAAGIHAVIIDRPDKRNACDVPTWECLANAFQDAALNPDIRVLVFTGAGGHFCAGDDISATSQIASDPVLMQRCVNPMASYCDFRVAGHSARIGITATNHAIAYPTAHLQVLVNLIGLQATRRWLYGAELHNAASAVADGFADFGAADTMEKALRIAAPLLAKPPISLAIGRAQLDAVISGELRERAASIELMIQKARAGDDRREAVRAFLEKRKPRFTSL